MKAAQEFFEEAAGIGADGHPLNADGKRSGQTDTHWSSPRREASEGDLAEWEEKLARQIEERAFDITTTPIRPTPSFYINGVGISTAGNLTVISAASKAGKSAFISAMQASAMVVEDALQRDGHSAVQVTCDPLALVRFIRDDFGPMNATRK